MNQDTVVDFNSIYVSEEAEDFVMTATTAAHLFQIVFKDLHKILETIRQQRVRLSPDEMVQYIRTIDSIGREQKVRAINQEMSLYIAYHSVSEVSSRIREFVNNVVKAFVFQKPVQLTGESWSLNYPEMADKAGLHKDKILREAQSKMLTETKNRPSR
ncbi:MAG: hypothetical protein LBD03_06605 [Methanobrevibacter sp.]|jgi:hypothetical protein|nr:hypothetical protein [Candidatus Methanovirga procula]